MVSCGCFCYRPMTHLQLLQGSGSHVGVLEVDEGTEALVKNSDALYLTKPVTVETQNLKPPAEKCGSDNADQLFYCCWQ